MRRRRRRYSTAKTAVNEEPSADGRLPSSVVPASPVRPELGPTLPALLASLPRAARAAVIAVAVLVLGLAAWSLLRSEAAGERLTVGGPAPFNLNAGLLERVPAERGEALRLVAPASLPPKQTLTVSPLTLAPYAGDPVAALMSIAQMRADRLRAELGGVVVRGEGRTRINDQPGYQLQYQFTLDGQTAYGRLLLLVPSEEVVEHPRRGVALDLRTQRSPAVPSIHAAGDNGPLKTPMRSFRFGTESP